MIWGLYKRTEWRCICLLVTGQNAWPDSKPAFFNSSCLVLHIDMIIPECAYSLSWGDKQCLHCFSKICRILLTKQTSTSTVFLRPLLLPRCSQEWITSYPFSSPFPLPEQSLTFVLSQDEFEEPLGPPSPWLVPP